MRSRTAISLCLLLAFARGSETGPRLENRVQQPPRWVVSFQGVGPVRFGMSLRQASAALGEHLPGRSPEDTSSKGRDCPFYYTTPKTAPESLSFMVEDDTIVRADITRCPYATMDGFHIGSAACDIRQRSGDRLELGTSLGGNDLLLLRSRDPERRFLIVFEMTAGRVSSYRAGRGAAAELEECE